MTEDNRTELGRELEQRFTEALALECEFARAFSTLLLIEEAGTAYVLGDITDADILALSMLMETNGIQAGKVTEEEAIFNEIRAEFELPAYSGPAQSSFVGV